MLVRMLLRPPPETGVPPRTRPAHEAKFMQRPQIGEPNGGLHRSPLRQRSPNRRTKCSAATRR
eukprot:3100713-Alexandrium_andersonii.AAC.1